MVNNLKEEMKISLRNDLRYFVESFSTSGVLSIDIFLSGEKAHVRRNFLKIGKIILYYLINYYENHTTNDSYLREMRDKAERIRLPLEGRKPDWIEKIMDTFLRGEDYELFFTEGPLIISFNYDCILEKKLKGFLENQKGLSERDALALIDELKIYHVYGSIETHKGNPLFTKNLFNAKINLVDIYKQAQKIRTVPEEREANKRLTKDISSFKRLYFFGFGFDEQNISVLADLGIEKHNSLGVYSTSIKMERDQRGSIDRHFGGGNLQGKREVSSYDLALQLISE